MGVRPTLSQGRITNRTQTSLGRDWLCLGLARRTVGTKLCSALKVQTTEGTLLRGFICTLAGRILGMAKASCLIRIKLRARGIAGKLGRTNPAPACSCGRRSSTPVHCGRTRQSKQAIPRRTTAVGSGGWRAFGTSNTAAKIAKPSA
jgi:hypothetical protein